MRILLLFIVSSIVFSCSQKSVPLGLRRTIKRIDKNLNDTVKYDYQIAPESVATSKHHFGLGMNIRNGFNLWKGGLLSTNFKLNGIKHPDDMSGIILTTYHRKLNNRPVKFREQKEYYKTYWKVSKQGQDSLNLWWSQHHNPEEEENEQQKYYSRFKEGVLVAGSVSAWKQYDNGNASLSDVGFTAEVVDSNERNLKLRIIEIGEPKSGFELFDQKGDTIETDVYGVYLIRNEQSR